MPRITDTVTDDAGRPTGRARVLITRLVSEQDPTTGTPARTELMWRGRTNRHGTWEAELPAQLEEGRYYIARIRSSAGELVDEFAVDATEAVQQVKDRLRPDRPKRPRPEPTGRHRPERTDK